MKGHRDATRGDAWVSGRPAPELRAYITSYTGYRSERPALVHRGLPSTAMTFIVSVGDPIRIAQHSDPHQAPSTHRAVLGGLHTTPALIARDGPEEGVAIGLTPLGSRALLGLPAGELADLSLEAELVLGRTAAVLAERLALASSWTERFAGVDGVLARRADHEAQSPGIPTAAWTLLQRSGGLLPVATVAEALGYTRRHLSARFRAEFGLTPKDVGRVMRFNRAVDLLRAEPDRDLATLAATCGYADQAHLAREFRAHAGCPPTTWVREEFPSVQDAGSARAHARTAAID